MAIVVDVDDLSKTLLLSSAPLIHQTRFHLPLYLYGEQKMNVISEVKYIIVLEADRDVSNMPLFSSHLPDCTVETLNHLNQPDRGPYLRMLETAKKVKQEPQGTQGENVSVPTLPNVDWIKAYQVFLSIVKDTKIPSNRAIINLFNMLGNDAKSALPQIEGLIDIAKLYHAMPAITTSLTLVVHKYTGNSTLYRSIAAEAASWLLIGKEIEDEVVFKEAFCHVAGCYPDWPWQKPLAAIPKELKTAIHSKSRDLKLRQQAAYVELSQMTVLAKRHNDEIEVPVSQHNNPIKYDVVNFWWYWITEHYQYVNGDTTDEEGDGPKKSWFCDHSDQQCLTIAGLFRAISKKGEAYLPFEQLLEKWNHNRYRYTDETAMQQTLKDLKTKAAEIVEPLVDSPLQLQNDQKDKLDYLTSIPLEEEDMPWNVEDEDDESDDDDT